MASRRRLARLRRLLRQLDAAAAQKGGNCAPQVVHKGGDCAPQVVHFGHCGEHRDVSPPPTLLDQLGPGHHLVGVGDRPWIPGSGAKVPFELRGPRAHEREFAATSVPPELAATWSDGKGVDAVSVGPLDLRPPAAGATPADLARQLDEDGLLYLPGVLAPEAAARLRGWMDATPCDPANPIDSGPGIAAFEQRLEEARAAGDPKPYGEVEVMSFWNRAEPEVAGPPDAHLQLIDLEPTISVAEAALGEDCHLMQHKAWTTGPGRPGSRLHVDFMPVRGIPERLLLEREVRVPSVLITAHFYMEDVTEDLGPTYFIPRSHLSGRWPEPTETSWRGEGPRSALCKAGDCLLFRSDVWHSSSPNTSARARHLMQVHFASRLISHPRQPIQAPPTRAEVLRGATARQRRLLAGFPVEQG